MAALNLLADLAARATHTMKTLPITLFAIALLLPIASPAIAGEEQDLIQILVGNSDASQKADAASRLRRIGTANAVPALEALLPIPATSQAARHALEGMPFPEAVAALRESLARTSGLTKAGLIESLGWRRDTDAVPLLKPLLSNPDATLAAAAASALGKIGGADVLDALESARDTIPDEARPALIEGLMRCAEEKVHGGDRARAAAIYESLFAATEPAPIRTAAYAGMIHAAEDGGMGLVLSALEGQDASAQTAALQLAGELRQPGATIALAELLAKSSPGLQIALLALLETRGDEEALPAVLETARNSDPAVRAAAIAAVGALGDASTVALLAQAATATDPSEQSAARQALTTLNRGEVTESIVELLSKTTPAIQVELVRALSARSDPSAMPALFDLAREDGSPARRAALQALGQLVDGSQMSALVQLLLETKDDTTRDQIRGVFETLIERTPEPQTLDLDPILQGLESKSPETRASLLPVSVLFVDDRLRAALRVALKDDNETIHNAAARALCASRDVRLLPDLLDTAGAATDASLRSLAFEGIVRLATDDAVGLSAQQRANTLDAAFALATRPEEKRRVLSGIARVPHPVTLGLADQACADAGIRPEAELACLQIAQALGTTNLVEVETVLNRLAKDTTNPSIRTDVQALLQHLDSGWLCTGPYRVAGKQAQQLFDIPFPPEQNNAGQIDWQRAPGSSDLARPGEVDLAGITGGDHCVVYAKTRVYVPAAEAASFAIGSDDGIKLWLNGELIHANNAVRGLTPDQDHAAGQLRQGWNDLLAKITQHTAGCGFTLRMTRADGSDIPGLRLDPSGVN